MNNRNNCLEEYRELILSQLGEAAPLLCSWFEREKADLPWRADTDAYHVWVSEIMLQQTRIEAVKPYYERFIGKYPDLRSLAASDEEELMKLWEGLGYYSRVRNMRKAALVCVDRHGGILPQSYSELLKLPGIGSYTAGAVSSISFGEKRAVTDGNVMRVVFRLCRVGEDAADASVREALLQILNTFVDREDIDAGLFNQAVMELGERVCLPNGAPDCEECPVRRMCLADASGIAKDLPYRSPKTARKVQKRTVFIVTDGGGILLHRRKEKGLLAGLYELPGEEEHLDLSAAKNKILSIAGEDFTIRRLSPARHVFTHLEWDMRAYLAELPEGQGSAAAERLPEDYVFATFVETKKKYAIPGAFAAWKNLWTEGISQNTGTDESDQIKSH